MANLIPREEIFILLDGERPIEITEDTKVPNAATIRVNKQDHTLGNMLRHQLFTNPAVLFSGYKVPHPLQSYFLIKVQTDGSVTPTAALEKASTDLIGMLNTLEQKFTREFSYREIETDEAAAMGAAGADVDLEGVGRGGEYDESAWTGRDYLDI